jgi:hypothetical protein
MLTARNVVAVVVAIAVISLVSACISVMRPPDSGGMGRDTYGTRAAGQRALFETLEALGVPVERLLMPPTAVLGRNVTLVFWRPHGSLVDAEPAYLRTVANWIRQGGRVVVAPSDSSVLPRRFVRRSKEHAQESVSIIEELGLPLVALRTVDLTSPVTDEPAKPVHAPDAGKDEEKPTRNPVELAEEQIAELEDFVTKQQRIRTTRPVTVQATGAFSGWQSELKTIEVPAEGLRVIDDEKSTADGRLTLRDDSGHERTLAASFRVGQGEVIVVGAPEIAENRAIARHDNSVLLTRLLTARGRPVVFDEFYHGLTIRGNPLWLFTRQGYRTAVLSLLLLLGLWIWRESVFLGPPLPAPAVNRRSIGEYVEAMARFLGRGEGSRLFALREVREGVLHTIRRDLGLPPGRERPEDLAAALARRDPRRARQLMGTVASIDETLARRTPWKEQDAIRLLREISSCL